MRKVEKEDGEIDSLVAETSKAKRGTTCMFSILDTHDFSFAKWYYGS